MRFPRVLTPVERGAEYTPLRLGSAWLTFQPRQDDPTDEVTLSEKEQRHAGHDHDDRAGHQQVVLWLAGLHGDGLKVAHPQRDGELLWRVQEDERLDEGVPVEQEREDRNGRDRRATQRYQDVPQDLQRVGPVDLGRLVKVARDGHEELAHQEYEKRPAAEPMRHDQRRECVKPTQRSEEEEARHDSDL